MNAFFVSVKIVKRMLKKTHNYFSRGKDWYYTYKKEIKLASKIKIKNKLLYTELELECRKREGILTYGEYLTIDQFGKQGYYHKSIFHGKTDIDKRWGSSLAKYCQDLGYETMIEFGCGTAELGVATVKAYKELTKKQLKWIGVEIDTSIHKKIIENFSSKNMQNSILKIAASIEDLLPEDTILIVFPYSLDNIPPEVFINTSSVSSYPDALLGIIVENGMLSEVIIPPKILKKKGVELANGFYKKNKFMLNLSSWKLRKGQRAYIPTDSFITLYQYAKSFGTNSTFIIVDEFKKEPWSFSLDNIGVPKSLYENNLIGYDRTRYYRESGKHNLYYPLYKDTLFQFLRIIGFQSIELEIEQKKAAQLQRKKWFPISENYTTLAFISKNFTNKKLAVLPIPFTPQRIMKL